MSKRETYLVAIITVIVFIAAFLIGFLFGNSAETSTSKTFAEPVTAVVAGEEMPVISVEYSLRHVVITTDGGEKIYADNKSVIIYETEKYYEEG